MDKLLRTLSLHYGIQQKFTDLAGIERPTSQETQLALLAANGLDVGDYASLQQIARELQHAAKKRIMSDDLVIPSDQLFTHPLATAVNWRLIACEDHELICEGKANNRLELPPLGAGIYELTLNAASHTETVTLLVSPQRCPSLEDVLSRDRAWGVNAALYGLRSERNLGVGDYADLATLCTEIGRTGASFVGLNPVHALGSNVPEVISPYSPSHRGLLDTYYIAPDRIPGLEGNKHAQHVCELAQAVTREKYASPLIDYPLQRRELTAALAKLYTVFKDSVAALTKNEFEDFKREGTVSLQDYVLFEAISRQHGTDWRDWPVALRVRDVRALDEFRHLQEAEIDFHYWLQWVADVQLKRVADNASGNGLPLGLYLDFAVGSRRGGAESWCEMDSCATGVSIGAPPDHLSPAGQNWQLSGFAPLKLRRNSYRPYQLMLRSVMQYASMLRIDHVLGLNRIFWIPDDGSPGGYIQQPFDSLMAVVKIEAQRAGTVIVGEDLGLVPKGFREATRKSGFYGYSVLQYEKNKTGKFNDPQKNEQQTLACFSTHDTPTIRGYAEGIDIGWWQRLDWIDEAAAAAAKLRRRQDNKALQQLARAVRSAPGNNSYEQNLTVAIHHILATSNSALVTVQLDDILESVEAQNLPGTTTQHPNWRRRYPLDISRLSESQNLRITARQMNRTRPGLPARRPGRTSVDS